ncbi:SGNH family hydrolase [Microbaculum marinum]|uniref:SGNH family hydrolase n=1 Tax=Microbaculum marinum TaxID=1764581 RepID=A0AAW9RUB9_9HYPH
MSLAFAIVLALAAPASAQWPGLLGDLLLGRTGLADIVSVGTTAQQKKDPISAFFNTLFGGLTRKSQPTPQNAVPPTRSSSGSAPARAPAVVQPKKPAAAEKAPDAKRVVVFGDFFADGLESGLKEAFLESSSVIVEGLSSASSGLVRDDHYDWPEAIAERLLDTEKPVDIAVVMIGANDRQELGDAAGEYPPRSERWRELYSERIDQIIELFTDRNIPLYFVSLPPVASGTMSQDYAYFNDIFRERAYRYGIEFVDLWNSFVDEAGNYTSSGPDVNGEHRQLRGEDGLHFTAAGNRKLAHFVAREIRRDFGREGGLFLALPHGPTGPQPFLPSDEQIRTGVGEVIPLTGTQGGSGSALAGGPDPTPEAPRDSAFYQVILEGEVPAAEPGRADDFSWPRQSSALPTALPPDPSSQAPGEASGQAEETAAPAG